MVASFAQPRHLAPHHDALTRGQGQLAAGTFGLAVTALDALVDFRLDRRQLLQVG